MSRSTGKPLRVILILLTACLIVSLGASPVQAEGFQITPFAGYRSGGEFEDAVTGTKLSISEGETVGLIINKDYASDTQIELYYSHQPTRLTTGGPVTPGALLNLDVDYYHVGGRVNRDSERTRAFIVGTLGATHFNPTSGSFESRTRFSLSIGGGVEFKATERLGFRFEGRGFATFLNSDGAFFCDSSSNCIVFVSTDILWQFEAGAGVVFNF